MALEELHAGLPTATALLALAGSGLRAEAVARLTCGENGALFEIGADDGRDFVTRAYSDHLDWKLEKEVLV
jgi:hypothetical protein